jgi:uncharacterized protein (DUF1919 family)
MIKLTVMYNLPAEADHNEFIRWRTTEHQEENMSITGVLKSDFYVIRDALKGEKVSKMGNLPYRYITEVYWPDMEAFKAAFFDPEYQKQLAESLKKIEDPVFLVSEEMLSESNE